MGMIDMGFLFSRAWADLITHGRRADGSRRSSAGTVGPRLFSFRQDASPVKKGAPAAEVERVRGERPAFGREQVAAGANAWAGPDAGVIVRRLEALRAHALDDPTGVISEGQRGELDALLFAAATFLERDDRALHAAAALLYQPGPGLLLARRLEAVLTALQVNPTAA
jgi:hypothetical protein